MSKIKHEAVIGTLTLMTIDPTMIVVKQGWNPRTLENGALDLGDIDCLAESIRENGLKVPLRVSREIVKGENGKVETDRFILEDGERRLTAIRKLLDEGVEMDAVPCYVDSDKSEVERFISAMVANTGEPLSFPAECASLRRLVSWGVTQAEIAKRLGKDPSFVSDRIKFASDASPAVKRAVEQHMITKSEGVRIARRGGGSVEKQDDMLSKAKSETRTVRKDGKEMKSPRQARRTAVIPETLDASKTVVVSVVSEFPYPIEFLRERIVLVRRQFKSMKAKAEREPGSVTERELGYYKGIYTGLELAIGDRSFPTEDSAK